MIDRDRPIADHDTDERDNTRSDRVHRGSQLRRDVDPEVTLPSPKLFERDEHRCGRRRSEVCATSGRQQRGNEKEGERDRHRFDTAATRVNVSRGCTRGNRCPLWLALEASLSPPPAAGENDDAEHSSPRFWERSPSAARTEGATVLGRGYSTGMGSW